MCSKSAQAKFSVQSGVNTVWFRVSLIPDSHGTGRLAQPLALTKITKKVSDETYNVGTKEGNKGKKELMNSLGCSITHLLFAYTWQLEMLVAALID